MKDSNGNRIPELEIGKSYYCKHEHHTHSMTIVDIIRQDKDGNTVKEFNGTYYCKWWNNELKKEEFGYFDESDFSIQPLYS